MKKSMLTAAACMLLGALASVANAQMVSEKAKSFYVTYRDNSGETILVRYEGHLEHSQANRGGAAKPLKGKFVDDRHCVWSIDSYVTRQAYFVSRSGQTATIGQMSRVWNAQKNDRRGPRNAVQAVGYHQTCGDVQGTINNQVAGARNALIENFDEIVAADAEQLAKDLKDYLRPVSLRPKT